MRKQIIYALLVPFVLAFCLYVAPTATAASDEEEVLQVAENWNKAVNTGDFELMSSLYWNSPKTSSFPPWKEAAFLLQGYEAIMNWIKPTFESLKGTTSRTYHHPQVTLLGDDVAVVTLYEVIISNSPDVEEQTIDQNRQTLVVQKIGGKWLIVHDQGSAFPTE